jgi:3-oxoacyl-[acyl-carrier-protein] synthase II
MSHGKAYINGVGNISPQKAQISDDSFLSDPASYHENLMKCIEPDYSNWISPQAIRRMSRSIKMGTTAAMMALQDAGLSKPDAIITGTGYGCLEDTIMFLTRINELKEIALNPTPFMQSTHNTIGSQIALITQCEGYNQTYVHEAFSFEHALLDALMLFNEGFNGNILVGGVDEITRISHHIKSRFELYRKELVNSLEIIGSPSLGTLEGEGSSWFVLSDKRTGQSISCVEGVRTIYKRSKAELELQIHDFLSVHKLRPEDIDVVIVGKSGDLAGDGISERICQSVFPQNPKVTFKHLCGEYSVASSFAMWLATAILKIQRIPPALNPTSDKRKIENVLIYNPYFSHHHSLLLITACQGIKN